MLCSFALCTRRMHSHSYSHTRTNRSIRIELTKQTRLTFLTIWPRIFGKWQNTLLFISACVRKQPSSFVGRFIHTEINTVFVPILIILIRIDELDKRLFFLVDNRPMTLPDALVYKQQFVKNVFDRLDLDIHEHTNIATI